jgi:hypothetical protein
MYAPKDRLSVKTLPVLNFVSRLSLRRSLALLMGLVIWFVSPAPVYALVDDRQITISSPTDISNKRQALIQFIWGSPGFPSTKLPSSVIKNVCSLPRGNNPPAKDVCDFVNNLSNLKRVDEIRIQMGAGQERLEGLAYHFIPVRTNNKLVILHHGHGCKLNDVPADDPALATMPCMECYGMQRAINALLHDGYSVLGMYMPHFRPDDCWAGRLHDPMFDIVTTGSPMKFFLEPVAVSLNYLKTNYSTDDFPQYEEFDMVGLSGGGWTTTVYSAIDPTIKFSFPVAGTIPLYLRSGGSIGDLEQTLDAFYRIAGYPDLYVMGSYGFGRKQVQILNRRDNCCFGQDEHDPIATGMSWVEAMRSYEAQVRQVMYTLGSGTFRLEIDEAAPVHMISHNTIVNVILSELNHGRRYIGAATSTDAFVRGMNGHLWHHGPDGWGGWEDTGIAMVGVPAVLEHIVFGDFTNKFDVLFRDPGNRLMLATLDRGDRPSWRIRDMNGTIITDPVATASGDRERFDVVALGGDYTLWHWWWRSGIINREQTSSSALGLGTPALVSRGGRQVSPPQLDIFFRGWDRAVYHMSSSGSAPWTLDSLGGVILDFPSAAATAGNTLRVYVRGQNSQLFEASQTNGSPWEWNSLSAVTGSTGTSLSGSPSASVQGDGVKVYMRTSAGNLSSFTLSGGVWGFLNHDGIITGSPTSTGGEAFVRGRSAGLWLFDGTMWTSLGGVFD